MGVLCQLGVHALQADRVGDFSHGEASFVQNGDDALVGLLHQVHDDLVVEVVDLRVNGVIVKSEGKALMLMGHGTACLFNGFLLVYIINCTS